MTLAAIRQGIAANLSTISGLRTSWFVPVDYDVSFARGSDTYALNVLIIGGRINERTAQSSLDAFLDSTGTSSVKTAIESDKTLGGAAHSLRVTDWSGYGPLQIGDAQYLTVTFRVMVNAI